MDTSRTVLLARHVMQRAVFVLPHDRSVLDLVYGDYTFEPFDSHSPRILVVARK